MSGCRLVLFALSGMGNSVLQSLVTLGLKPALLVTRQETGNYPYYQLQNIAITATELGIPICYGKEGEEKALQLKPDIILSATYHRILPLHLIKSATYAFNVHPSLLPRYRGPNPFFWVLMNGEHETGVTVHYLTEELDKGDIVLQKKLLIAQDETQGSLRGKLAELSAEMTRELFVRIDNRQLHANKQSESLATYFPNISEREKHIDMMGNAEKIIRQVRALSPWPGAILNNGIKIKNIHKIIPNELSKTTDRIIKIENVPYALELENNNEEIRG